MSKDLSTRTVKLNSLVKIGEDSIKAEAELVNKLQAELEQLKVRIRFIISCSVVLT